MSNVLYEAPPRSDNVAGTRDFAYLAEVDILGWKFRMMKDGMLVIDTPTAHADSEGRHMTMALGRGHVDLIDALIGLDPGLPDPVVPERYTDIGRIL